MDLKTALFAALFITAGVLTTIFGVMKLREAVNLSSNGIETIGEVVKIEVREVTVRKNEGQEIEERYREIVSFVTNTGERISAPLIEKHEKDKCAAVGEKLSIIYNPENPSLIMVSGDRSLKIIGILLILTGIAFSCISIKIFLKP